MRQPIRTAVLLFAVMTLLTGIAYPFAVTGLTQALFARQANDSLLKINEEQNENALVCNDEFGHKMWGVVLSCTPPSFDTLRLNVCIPGVVGVGEAVCVSMWLRAMISRFGFN